MTPLAVLGEAHVCVRCAARGPTCCEPEDGVPLAPLTPGDLRRITSATGLEPAAFAVERVIDAEEVAAIEAEDPALAGLVGADGIVRSLAKRGRACVFLKRPGGCSLSYGVRPLLCRRFPVVSHGGDFRAAPGGDCLAVEEAADMPALRASLGMDGPELARIERQLRRDLAGEDTSGKA